MAVAERLLLGLKVKVQSGEIKGHHTTRLCAKERYNKIR